MVATVPTVAYLGLEARAVEVQCSLIAGVPNFNVVGLGDKAVAESRERVRGAIASLGLSLPPKRITVNLSPADLPKEGSHYDLPIALALLGSMGIVDAETLASYVVVGELGLDGRIAASPGVLLAALHASEIGSGLVCPAVQGSEAAWAGQIEVIGAPDLLSLLNHFKGQALLPPPAVGVADEREHGPDLRQVKGQETAKRALEIAAEGGHNLLMVGPPGAGKSLMASCLPGILPDLTAAEALEVSMVASVAGALSNGRLVRTRPFRSPHHSASMAALTGGGLKVKPGEVSLAHLGVLFLDELPEFQRAVLDSLRQPLETGNVSVARANAHVTFPARVQLIAAMSLFARTALCRRLSGESVGADARPHRSTRRCRGRQRRRPDFATPCRRECRSPCPCCGSARSAARALRYGRPAHQRRSRRQTTRGPCHTRRARTALTGRSCRSHALVSTGIYAHPQGRADDCRSGWQRWRRANSCGRSAQLSTAGTEKLTAGV